MDHVQLTVIGSSDAFNSGGRGNSCYWVDDDLGTYIVDYGPTAPLKRKLFNLDLSTLDGLYLTHLHGDHIGGIPGLLIDLCFLQRRTRPLWIGGPVGTKERLEMLYSVSYPGTIPDFMTFPIEYYEWPLQGETLVGGRMITSIPAHHDEQAHPTSIRIESAGSNIAFSGDTGWNEALIPLTASADLFVCECSYRQASFPGHLSLEEIERYRDRLTPKTLMLTHLNENAREGAEIERERLSLCVADDGMILIKDQNGRFIVSTPE